MDSLTKKISGLGSEVGDPKVVRTKGETKQREKWKEKKTLLVLPRVGQVGRFS